MDLEFEEEQSHPDQGRESLLQQAQQRLRSSVSLPYDMHLGGSSIDTSDLAADHYALNRQLSRLDALGRQPVAVKLKSVAWPKKGRRVKVIVDFGELHFHRDVDQVSSALTMAGLTIESVFRSEAEQIFLDRVAETIALRAAIRGSWPGSGSSGVVISSSRLGDEILCAKGWFLSTSTVIGQSTCNAMLAAGRYSFGVRAGGAPKFHPDLWSVPTSGPIQLRLP